MDDNEWAVMTIQPFARSGSIPRVGRMAEEDNEWEWPHHPRFDPLAKKYEGVFAGREETPGGWANLAVDTLAVNYRIHPHLAMAMRLFDQSHASQIIKLAMDLPELEAYQEAKKRGVQRSDVSVSIYGELTLDASQDTELPTQPSTG